MPRFETLFYAYRNDGRVREPLHADPDCHHVRRAEGTVRPVSVARPVARDVCGTCAGDVETVDDDPDVVLGADGTDETVTDATTIAADDETDVVTGE